MHQVVYQVQLCLCCLIARVKLQSLLELVLSRLVLAGLAEDESPDDPALGIERLLGDSLPDFLDGLDDVAQLELSEGPVHVRVVPRSVELFRLPADVQRLRVDHVDVEEESKIVVGERMSVIHQYALFEMLNGMLVIANFKVSQPQIVLQLWVFIVDSLCFFEGCNRKHILSLFVHGNTIVKECLPARSVVLLQVLFTPDGQCLPILRFE